MDKNIQCNFYIKVHYNFFLILSLTTTMIESYCHKLDYAILLSFFFISKCRFRIAGGQYCIAEG